MCIFFLLLFPIAFGALLFSMTHTIGCSQALEHLRKRFYCISIYRVAFLFC